MVGEVLVDRYEVEELVGAGGMSSVYRAHDRLLERKVALKVMHQHYVDDPEYVERFRREARSVASISHPNVVTVIDRGEWEGRQFIVFEYVDGENLKQLIERRGPAPVAMALELAIQIGQALSFAHQQGLVHRDVKPQNVLLNGDGRAKVTDFGIARSLDVQQGTTQTGTVLGTSDYIAPEQAQGQHVDEQTDVYSLGVVIFELLTASVPFPGTSFVAVAMRHINEPPPRLRDARPDVPLRVEAAVQRAMAKSPADRFPTMAAFCAELSACLGELSGGATEVIAPAKPRRPRPARSSSAWPVVLALLALIIAGAVAGWIVLHRNGTLGGGSHLSSPLNSTVQLQAVTAYDPFGDGNEHDSDAHLATDASTSTYWETESYHSTFAALGKKGVGLVLDAGSSIKLRQLGIATATPGFRAQIEAGDSATGPFDTAVSPNEVVTTQMVFPLTVSSPHRYYVIWITALPNGSGQARINDVTASG
ncbi:MAG TPA: protein kinase [Gaiellaceae bacterium]|nr:protein kinase [Gaiellaceae bacterium]